MQSTVTHFASKNGELRVAIQQLPHAHDLPLPNYATAFSAGMDLLAAIDEDITLNPGERCLVPSGIALALPQGFEAQIRARSGLSFKQGLTVLNAPGTIDADYRGEIKGLMINLGQEPVVISRGMRFAQMIIAAHSTVVWQPVHQLDETDRGYSGFGSTGVQPD